MLRAGACIAGGSDLACPRVSFRDGYGRRGIHRGRLPFPRITKCNADHPVSDKASRDGPFLLISTLLKDCDGDRQAPENLILDRARGGFEGKPLTTASPQLKPGPHSLPCSRARSNAVPTSSGCAAISASNARAAASGRRRPCSQSRTVAALRPKRAANSAWVGGQGLSFGTDCRIRATSNGGTWSVITPRIIRQGRNSPRAEGSTIAVVDSRLFLGVSRSSACCVYPSPNRVTAA